MLIRALAAVLVFPGVVAFAVPIALGRATGAPVRHAVAAAAIVCAGTILLLWCVREFYVAGRGTLAPWSPPKHLVTSGPYARSRNPMYIAVAMILLGWWCLWGARALLIYALAVPCAFVARVILVEEPWAARTFKAEWEAYRARVPRWIARLPRRS